MTKKRNFGLILTAFLSLGILLFSNNLNNYFSDAKADNDLVGTPTVGWNNVDYSRSSGMAWVKDVNDNGVPTKGYCLLPLYPSSIATNTYFSDNLLDGGVAGCNVGDHILINGIPSKDVKDTIIYGYPTNGFFIYVPHASITFSLEYEYCTIEVLEGMSIDGAYQTVATRFEYRGILGSFGNWQVNPEPIEKTQSTFEKIEWNNIDYSDSMGHDWVGEKNTNGSPKNGYCILIGFKEEGKTYDETVIGDLSTEGRGVLGIGLSVDYMIKINGVNLVDVTNSKCYIFPYNGLFLYLPEESMTFTKEYSLPTIEIEEGLHFNSVCLPNCKFVYENELGTINGWVFKKNPSEMNHFPFSCVANGWNNIYCDSSHSQTILTFGTPDVTYLKNDKISNDSNLVAKYSDCGNKISINGIPLWRLPDSLVSYLHGNSYVYLYLSNSSLIPSNGYKVVTLHIDEGTEFWDTLLPEVNLYLYNGAWITERPETPEDSDYDGAISFSDISGKKEASLTENNPKISGSKGCSLDTFGLFVDYKLLDEGSSFTIFAAGKEEKSGFKIVLMDNVLSLYDVTDGNVALGSATLDTFVYDEWFSLFFYTRYIDEQLIAYVAIDDIIFIHVNDVQLGNPSNIGDCFSFLLISGEASLKNAVLKGDNKKPQLTFTGKDVYGALVGSEPIDFSNKCSALDLVDGDVSDLIEYIWPEGSVTNDKLNEGFWNVTIIAKDKSNNKAKLSVLVVVKNNLEVTVTFDGANPTRYNIGDHIACVPDPVKENSGVISYKFIGWYYEGKLWDFENDYVLKDINLESKFQETVKEYRVSFTVEGLDNLTSFDLYFQYGVTLNMSTFERDGYTMVAYVDGKEVKSITITGDAKVKLVYKNTNPEKKDGCKGDLTSSLSVIAILSGVAVALLVFLKKKGEKDYE